MGTAYAGTALSGVGGCVHAGGAKVAEVTDWKVSMRANNPAWASSSTDGYKTRKEGVKDLTGSFSFKIDASLQYATTLAIGTEVVLNLYGDASGTLMIEVPAIIDSIDIDVNINEGDVINGSCGFSSRGAWTGGEGTAITHA